MKEQKIIKMGVHRRARDAAATNYVARDDNAHFNEAAFRGETVEKKIG